MKMKRSTPMTKNDLKNALKKFATKSFMQKELKRFATKDDLKGFATKEDLHILRKEITREIIQGVNVRNENLLYDFRGVFSDRTVQHNEKLENHEQRIVRVEQELNLAT